MRNCFTKISNVFRKKPNSSQLEHSHLSEFGQFPTDNEELDETYIKSPPSYRIADKQNFDAIYDKNVLEQQMLEANEIDKKDLNNLSITSSSLGKANDNKNSSQRKQSKKKQKEKQKQQQQQQQEQSMLQETKGNKNEITKSTKIMKTSTGVKIVDDKLIGQNNVEQPAENDEPNNKKLKENVIATYEKKVGSSDKKAVNDKNVDAVKGKKGEIDKIVLKSVDKPINIHLKIMATDDDARSYIEEYKTFMEDRHQSISSPYPIRETFQFEEALNFNAFKRQSIRSIYNNNHNTSINSNNHNNNNNNKFLHTTNYISEPLSNLSTTPNQLTPNESPMPTASAPKTPEEIDYEEKAAAEYKDVMTPLPTNNLNAKQYAFGRNIQPEVAECIRSLDANALRLNNLTMEDKIELLRRFDHQQQRKHSRSKSYILRAYENRFRQYDESSESGTEEVVLRRKVKPQSVSFENSSLYERRQPECPKLKLVVQSNKKEGRENSVEDLEKNLMDLKYPTVLPPNPQLKALLVFHKSDNICEVMTQACHRQQLDVTVVKTKEAALEILSNTNTTAECYHLIVIDARSTKYLDAEYITRSIRHTNGHHFTTIIAVVKKSFFEKDDVLIALLDAGVNRCMAETTNLSLCSIELKQILHSIVRPHNVMSTQQALYTALHRLKEVLIITDDVLRIQYANKSAERLLNMRLDEIISKPLADIFISDVSSISAHGKSIREFDGILTVRRKCQDGIPMHVRVVPVACIGRTPTHFVFNFDVPGGQNDFIATLPQPKEAPRGSLHSIRRGSFDVRSVASDGLRRTSLAKLTSLPLEAPITKIINLLSQVQENCSADEARLIDKVLEFLKREGLYSPQMKEIRTEDPIATDLIGALLTGPSLYSSRRSSNDSIIRVSSRPSGVMPAKMKATPLIMELLEESLSWEFDIFKLEDITEKRPLLYLGMEIFRRFDVFATLNIDENICKSWLAVIEANYHEQNSYHNSTHAADVMQATGSFLTQLSYKEIMMDRMDEATALIAAAAHDIDHPGRSSAFLCNSNSPLAVLYNDLTVLESHHAATTFKLTLGDDKINIFKNLDKDTYKSVRSTIVDMILATEMTRHFEHLAKFVSVFGTDVEPRDIVQTEDESSILIRRMLIKVADVSNPARQPAFCVEWARRIAEEYFMQTDEEKTKSLPIVMPMFDRATCSIPKSQIGFIEYIIQDMMHAWDSFIDMPQLITYMQINYSQWKKFEEQGIHTLADIKTKQVSLNAKKTTCK